jgi:hypothetical protein
MIRELEQLGWRVTGGGGVHYRLLPPEGAPIVISCSPTDPRVPTYFRRALEKARKEVPEGTSGTRN